jgi:site-specific DNA-methyltransferase (adenine-specific)
MAVAYIPLTEAARRLHVSEETVRRWCDRGQIPSVRHPLNNRRQVSAEAVEKIVESMSPEGTAA